MLAGLLLPQSSATAQSERPDEIVWRLVKDSADAGTLTNFVTQFPDSPHVSEAVDKVRALTDEGTAFDASAPIATEPGKRSLTTKTKVVTPKTKQFRWVDSAIVSDWRGQDRASSSGSLPIEQIGGLSLCDASHAGWVAVCWGDRSGGYPSGVPSDFSDRPAAWCTYKKSSIKASTAKTGRWPGRVYVCQ
jgi:hypothetical protein